MSIVEVQQQPVAQSPEIREAMQRLNRAIEEAKALQTTERIIASVERTMMGRVLEPYDSANALEATRKSNEAIRLADLNLIKTAQDCLLDELHLWRVSVAKRDDEVMPYNLRRYCEHTNEGLDVASYAALTRFYRSRPNTNITQSKYDLVVTRMCAPPTKGGLRILRHDRQQLAMYLARLFASWDMSGSVALQTMDTSGETIDLMRGFDAFIAEANEVASIEDLVRRELFNRVRAFKSSLVDTFYEPAVSAAAIDCNVVLSNRFTTLLEAEGEQIRDAPSACRELATVFSDTSCEGAHEEMTELLAELQTEVVSSEEAAARERLTRLGALLRLACPTTSVDAENSASEATELTASSGATQANAGAELPEALRELVSEELFSELLAAYQQPWRSPEVRSLDFSFFLRPLSSRHETEEQSGGTVVDARYQALELIIRADDMLRHEMGDGRDIDAVLEARLTELLTEFAATDKQLSTLRTGAWQQRQREDSDALLYVANHLHEARLRLQSAIVNRSASELVRQKRTPAPVEVVEKPKKVEPLRPATAPATVELKPVPSPRFTKRRLLVAAAIVLAAMSGLIMSFSSSSPASMIGVDKEVSKLDTRELPNGHLLADARQRRNVLIGVVSPAWAQLPSHQKRDELQTLLKYGKDKGIGSIMLIDKLGMPAGSASEQQISIEDLETTP